MSKRISRREFLAKSGLLAAACYFASIFNLEASQVSFKKEARFYKVIDEKTVQCQLCPRRCTLSDGVRSFCRVREPKAGKLYSLVYGQVCAAHIDPMEKKPLFHFLPGSNVYSIATAGCNFRCKFCQNWQISQYPPEEVESQETSPEEVVASARKSNCPSIAYTYTEPSIFYEYMFDTAKLAKANGLKNMYHSNGSLNPEPLKELAFYLDGANVDLKGFTQEFYDKVCAGQLETVLASLKTLKEKGIWLEITNLIIPNLNDDLTQIRKMCIWIRDNLGKDVPLHFSRFWPNYRLTNIAPTEPSLIENARNIAMEEGLEFVYIGNLPGHLAESTYCPSCKNMIIQRKGFSVLNLKVKDGKCLFCGRVIPGVWS